MRGGQIERPRLDSIKAPQTPTLEAGVGRGYPLHTEVGSRAKGEFLGSWGHGPLPPKSASEIALHRRENDFSVWEAKIGEKRSKQSNSNFITVRPITIFVLVFVLDFE